MEVGVEVWVNIEEIRVDSGSVGMAVEVFRLQPVRKRIKIKRKESLFFKGAPDVFQLETLAIQFFVGFLND
jgi:hypothetical protein